MSKFFTGVFQAVFLSPVTYAFLLLMKKDLSTPIGMVTFATLLVLGGIIGSSIYYFCLNRFAEDNSMSAEYLQNSYQGFSQIVIKTICMSLGIAGTYLFLFAYTDIFDINRLLGVVIYITALVIGSFNATNTYLNFIDNNGELE